MTNPVSTLLKPGNRKGQRTKTKNFTLQVMVSQLNNHLLVDSGFFQNPSPTTLYEHAALYNSGLTISRKKNAYR